MSKLILALKRIFPKGLFARATLIMILPMILVQIVISVLFWNNHWDRVSDRLARDVIGDIRYVYTQINEAQTTQDIVYLQNRVIRYLDLSFSIQLGKVLTKSDAEYDIASKKLQQQLSEQIPSEWTLNRDPQNSDYFILSIQSRAGVVDFRFSKNRIFSSSIFVVVIWGVVAAIAFIIIAELFLRNQVRAIVKLAEVAEAFGKGRDNVDFRPFGAREVRKAGFSFLSMRHRLNRYIDQRTLMLSSISHDMRTPLTRLRLELDMMDQNDPAVQEMKQDVTQMQEMIKAWLAYIRGEESEESQSFSLSQCLEDVTTQLQKKYSSDNLWIQPYQPVIIEGKVHSLTRAFTNIIENALKYGNKAKIRYQLEENFVSITVEDEGKGIPKEEMNKVFRPFYRVESSRNSQTGGVGLGLAIAQDIITAHGGRISLENLKPKGLRCKIILPL